MRKATQQNPARQAKVDNARRKAEAYAAATNRQTAMFTRRTARDLMLGRTNSSPSNHTNALAGLGSLADLDLYGRASLAQTLTTLEFDLRDERREELLGLVDETVSLEDAAQILCGKTKDPMKNLKARIKSGTVQTVEVDGETRVIL